MATVRRRPRRGKAALPIPHNMTPPSRPPLAPWHAQRPAEPQDILCVGMREIAAAIEQPYPRVRHWLDLRVIASVTKRGRLHVAPRNALRREFGLDA
jgi:hypothetical protein